MRRRKIRERIKKKKTHIEIVVIPSRHRGTAYRPTHVHFNFPNLFHPMQVWIEMNVFCLSDWQSVCVCVWRVRFAHTQNDEWIEWKSTRFVHSLQYIYISFECGMATAWAVSSILYIFEIHPPYYYKYIIRYILYATWSTGFRKMLRSNSKTPRVHFILPPLLLLLQLVTTMMATASGLNPTTVLHQSCIIYTRPWTRWHTHTQTLKRARRAKWVLYINNKTHTTIRSHFKNIRYGSQA